MDYLQNKEHFKQLNQFNIKFKYLYMLDFISNKIQKTFLNKFERNFLLFYHHNANICDPRLKNPRFLRNDKKF